MVAVPLTLVARTFRLRNWRAVLLALAASAVIVALAMYPSWPATQVLQALIWGTLMYVLLLRSVFVGVIPEHEYRFLEKCEAILREIARLRARAQHMDPALYVDRFEQLVRDLKALEAPPPWRQLHIDTANELHRRLVQMRLHAKLTPKAEQDAAVRWQDVEGRFRRNVSSRAGFWNGWPGPRKSSDGRERHEGDTL